MKEYKVPDNLRIGHIHLKVSDLKRSLKFYCDILGFDLVDTMGEDAAFISAGGYHHHIGLNTWYSKNSNPSPSHSTGLFHFALAYPTRKDLAVIFNRLLSVEYPLTGMSDHGVSEAIYLNDPDKNGIELYWDKPKEKWPYKEDGTLNMYTKRLDAANLLAILDR